MSRIDTLRTSQEILGLLAEDLQLLARIHDRELDFEALEALRAVGFPQCFVMKTDDARATDAQAILEQAMRDLRAPDPKAIDALAADFADIYLNHSLHASPFESVWLDEDGLTMQQPMFEVRRWYEQFGMAAENWRTRSEDHIALQLQFIAHLLNKAAQSDRSLELLQDVARFLDEHLLRWFDDFSQRVAQRCATPLYAGSALLTASYLDALRGLLEQVLEQPRPGAEEIARRMKPKNEPVEVPLTYVPGASASW